MDSVRYSQRRLEQVFGVRGAEVVRAVGRKKHYSLGDMAALAASVPREPPRYGVRKQLFLNFKGGTGKTSLSTSWAYRLAERGYRVLLIDLDSQGHATKCMGKDGSDFPHTLHDVLIKKLPLREAMIGTGMPGLSFVPGNIRMSTIELALMPLAGREVRLRNALRDVEHEFDFVVMDAPPSFGLLNLNALMAATDLFVPVLADFLSYDGLKLLFETVQGLEEDLELGLEQIFIVVNAYNQTFKIAREALHALREHYGEFLLATVVRQCTKFAQASSEGCPIFGFDPDSKGAVDIEAVMEEALARIRAGLEQGNEAQPASVRGS
jgi:chromosome partitioning protein